MRDAQTRRDLHQEITNKIVEALEAGIVPWQKPWDVRGPPRNLKTGRAYRGANIFLLGLTAKARGFTTPYWLTFNQARELGGTVRRGERGTLVIFWRILERPAVDATGKPVLDDQGAQLVDARPVLRHYTVFNAAQCDLPEGTVPDAPLRVFTPDADAEAAWNAYDGPELRHGGDMAYYAQSLDRIQMPPREAFHSTEAYYGTLFHEGIHSTGHKDRLNRATLTQAGKFGDENYSQEELVAELGSAMLLANVGLEPRTTHSASYIAGWLKALRNDRRLIVVAAAQAQRAVDFILRADDDEAGEVSNGEPLTHAMGVPA